MTADTYVKALLVETPKRFSFCETSLEQAKLWQGEFRQELARILRLEAIATRGEPPLTAQLLSSEPQPDHLREEWRLETEKGFYLPFYLLRPHNVSGRLPLVLTPHGHNILGKKTYVGLYESQKDRQDMEEGERDIALQAVREGYIAIASDMRGFAGLRRQEDIDKDANNSCRTLQMYALLFGRTLIGERVWDIQRLLDWALNREDVDPDAVIITGSSGGGTVSLFAAALDERIHVCIPGSYFCTFKDSIASLWHCECNDVPNLLNLAEMADVAGLIAPRPFLAVNGKLDKIFPIEATKQSFANLQSIYGVFHAKEKCQLSIGEGGHRYYKRDVWPFVQR
ncbi:MAG: alpha/beta hydrolase family protein [Trueperaceae bacterium]